jgi:hypothetical protein
LLNKRGSLKILLFIAKLNAAAESTTLSGSRINFNAAISAKRPAQYQGLTIKKRLSESCCLGRFF